jgi:hypothetical protein
MKNDIGLWIDHKKAVIVFLGDESVQTINSNLERVFSAGGSHGINSGAKDFPAEDIRDRHIDKLRKEFYAKVSNIIKYPERLYIMGPGEAKVELTHHLKEDGYTNIIEKVETSDKLTDNQILAKVKAFFQD